jgi:hypothetical protein
MLDPEPEKINNEFGSTTLAKNHRKKCYLEKTLDLKSSGKILDLDP